MDKLLEEELVIPSVKYECKLRSRIFPSLSFVFTENLRTEILGASLRTDYSRCLLLHSRNLTQLVRNLGFYSICPTFGLENIHAEIGVLCYRSRSHRGRAVSIKFSHYGRC
jgi:hypothetical protein